MTSSPRQRRRLFALYLAATAAYLGYRALFTLDPDAVTYSLVFFGLECWAAVCSLTFFATVLERADRRAPEAPEGLTVDVFVCTYNEAIPLLRQTLRRARAMDYPHQTWLLDDGNRPEARALAEEVGCGYLARSSNEHFKAGNLNHALAKTRGELVMVLDADHLPTRSFLTRLLGYFRDPSVAVVQTPQVFYNLDSFQHHYEARTGRLWHEGALFHHAMQPGADRWNAAFFVGTGALLRRSALERIGGFAQGSVTEDAHTCLRLHAAGFRSVYHDEPLAYLLAPESLQQYLTQRLRWGQGSMQILRKENPLFCRGLSFAQRWTYFMALGSFGQALVHLAYYLAPAIFLLGGPAPLRATTAAQLLPLVLHIAVDLAAFRFFVGPLARPLLAECYKFLNVYAFLKALTGYFRTGRLKFAVTTKGRDAQVSLRLLLPQIGLLLLNATAFAAGTARVFTEALSPVALGGLLMALFFSGAFVVIGSAALWFAWERLAARGEYTFPDELPALWGAEPATVLRANESELHLLVPRALAKPTAPLEVTLLLGGGRGVAVHGSVEDARAATDDDGREVTVLQLALAPLAAEVRDALFDRFAEHAMPAVLNPLMEGWRAPREPAPAAGYYLPLQPNVL